MTQKPKSNGSSTLLKWLAIGLLILFVGSIIWSFVYETLMPLLSQGDSGAVVRNLIGFPIILGGTALFAYGGFVFVRDTFAAMANPQLRENVVDIKDKSTNRDTVKQARRQNLRMLLSSWKPGALRMALGFGLIAIGGWLINL
ncbi:MAG: hypothetical protein ACOC9Z_08440 [Chloroflexota bacterium]